tara:strand:+ start:8550 stop:8930 length:381 start_codon:yes stop_codon:yes gene_type:complete
MNKLIRISEMARKLNLVDPISKKPLNHILRYWEKEFKYIRPKKINNQRYYSSKQFEMIKMIKFLLKNKGMTIYGVKNLLKINTIKLDDNDLHGLKANYYKYNLKTKTELLLNKINKLRHYGKKNSS